MRKDVRFATALGLRPRRALMSRTAFAVAAVVALVLAGSARTEPTLPTCATAQLHVWLTHTGAAASNVGGYLAFTNRSPITCRLSGWPTLVAVRPGASAKAVHVHATMFGPYVGGTGPYVRGVPVVRLRHGQTAVAAFMGGDNPGPGKTRCPPAYRQFRVTPPGNVAAAVTRAWIAWLGANMPSCTRIEVTMVVPASDMPPHG
jgi:uncharacterized protein DUF4232